MNEQSVKSSPDKFRWDNPRIHGIGSNGSLATTRPSKLKYTIKYSICFKLSSSYIELNMPSKAIKVKLDANMDFILTWREI
jgi:hypothetical protein